eukprot:4835425-Pleurochrysis_carterae.AAC.2
MMLARPITVKPKMEPVACVRQGGCAWACKHGISANAGARMSMCARVCAFSRACSSARVCDSPMLMRATSPFLQHKAGADGSEHLRAEVYV